jgi:hypothetical protein
MGWERQRYYTRSKKIAGKVVREYYGKGAEGRLAAALDQKRRERKQAERQALGVERNDWNEACELLDALTAVTELLVTAVLLAEGLHQHDRGAWRRKRGKR